MGTPDFAEISLQKLIKSNHKIIGVVTKPDKPKGRGMKMISTPTFYIIIQMNLIIYYNF